MAYELEFPEHLAVVRSAFHITLLKKCVGDPASIVNSLYDEDVPDEILDHQVKRL